MIHILNVQCRAYEYMQKVQNLPCVWYQVNIKQAGITSKPTSCMYVWALGSVFRACLYFFVALHNAANHFP